MTCYQTSWYGYLWECPLCYKVEETTDYIFLTCDLAIDVWCKVDNNCPTLGSTNWKIMNWLEYLWHNKSWYNQNFGNALENVFTIL